MVEIPKLRIDPSLPRAQHQSSLSPNSASTTLSEDEDKDIEKIKGKPKRCRVTPEQLVHLERFFAAERSPTASRRRDICALLGMQERQTQIWFQNRRAKAKLQNSKLKKGNHNGDQSVSPTSTAFENELNSLIHEDDAVTFIPCSDLTIGHWRRIAQDSNQRDLVAYTCETKRCLTWFIHNDGFGFKMEIPFDTIVDTEYTNTSPASTGLATFLLSTPPLFFMEVMVEDGRRWKRCTDWTEGHQASHVLRHDLIGPSVPLVHLVQSLQPSSPYSAPAHSEPTSPMEIPPPPLSVIQQHAEPRTYSPTVLQPFSYRRRSLAAADDLSLVVSGLSQSRCRELPQTAPPMSYSHTSFIPTTSHKSFIDVLPETLSLSLQDFGAQPVLHDVTPRLFQAQPVPRDFYAKSVHAFSPIV